MHKQRQPVTATSRQRLLAALLALSFCVVVCAGAAQTLDVLLAKQVGESGGESGIPDLILLAALHIPWLVTSLASARLLWLLVQSTVHLPKEPTSAPNHVRPPPFAF